MMRCVLLLCCCLAGTVLGEDVSVLDFGAVPDGKTLTTGSLQNAIDHCSSTGGGTVTVPPGTYLTHTVRLKGGVNLLAPDARLAVVMDDCHHVRLSEFDVDVPTDDQPLVRVIQSTDVTISGYQSIQPVSNFLRAEGDQCSDIKLVGNDFSGVENVTTRAEGCPASALKLLYNLPSSQETVPSQ